MKKSHLILFIFFILTLSAFFGGNRTSEIPEVYISCSTARKNKTVYYVGSQWVDASIEIKGKNSLPETKIKIKERGNSTRGNGKLPYSIKFNKKTKVLGMKKATRWVLLANALDRSMIRTEFASYICNNVFNSTWNASFTPVNVYFNNCFIGTYDFGECNKISEERVSIQNLEDYAKKSKNFRDVNNDKKTDIEDAGFILEIDTDNENAERIGFYSKNYFLPFTLKDPDFSSEKYSDKECEIYRNYAKSKIDAFEEALLKDDFEETYKNYIDEDSFVDWYLINEFSKNSDAIFQKSVYIYYDPEDGKFRLGPLWDFDLAFGNYNCSYWTKSGKFSSCENPEEWYIHNGLKRCEDNGKIAKYLKNSQKTDGTYYYLHAYWIDRLFESKTFKQAVQNRWNKRKKLLKKAIEKQIPYFAKLIEKDIPANEMRLPRLGVESWNGPSDFAKRKTYEEEVNYLQNWCFKRYDWIDKKITAGDFD